MDAPTAATTPAAPAATTGVAGAAGAGAATLAGGPPGSLAAILQQLVTAIQGVVSAIGGAPVGAPVAPPAGTLAGGPTTGRTFETAARAALALQLPADLSGGNAIQVVDQIVALREQRVQQLASAIDADTKKFGTTNALDAQQLVMERTLNTQIASLAAGLRPVAQSIDATEGKAIVDLLQRANTDGRLDPGLTARTMMQVQGSARGLPQQLLDSSGRAADAIGRFNAEQNAMSKRIADTANATGSMPDISAVSQYSDKLSQLNAKVKQLFDSAASNPAQAQQRFDAVAAQTTIDGALAAIG